MLFRIFSTIILIACSYSIIVGQSPLLQKESTYYAIKKMPVPEGIILEAGGLAFDDAGKLAVCTRRGEIWTIENPASANPTFVRFAHGLHEPLGLAFKDGEYYCTQRAELTRIADKNGDGKADSFRKIYGWPLAGNYHEYSYGPLIKPDGNMLITLNLGWVGRGASLSKWRGWMLEVSPEGKMTPLAVGMRSPAGFGMNAEGDVFYTENQGDWVGSGRMTHIEKGDFVGHPEGLKWSGEPESPVKLTMADISDTLGYSLYSYKAAIPAIKPPSVWFPHTLMGISTSDILLIDHDKFGPFQGQMLVGDQGHSKIMRVLQEKIDGVYQGACIPFREGFSSGVLRLKWGPDKSLYVGMTNRGWASTGKEPYGIERLVYTGKIPFEVQNINIQPDGFLLTFTEPVNKAKAADPNSYAISDFTYLYRHNYGSPVVDLEKRAIQKVEVSDDGRSVRLFVEGLRLGYVYEIKTNGVQNRQNKPLVHPVAYYTLNRLPTGKTMTGADHSQHSAEGLNTAIVSPKRPTQMPASWTNGPDQSIELNSKAGMLFDKTLITVKAGSKVRLAFNNPDDMMHNFLLVKPGKADEISEQAVALGLEGMEKGFIPVSEDILYHTTLLTPNSNDVIYFVAPTVPGDYPYVCTFPGHSQSMRGVLRVE
ncbi:MAG: plastocyanin/azurin family copper-binding protein [Saprospiraceae bacterium]